MNYKYFLNKIIYFVILFFVTLTIGFIFPRLLPGNPGEAVLARISENGAPVSPGLLKAIDLEMGISNKPLYIQYFEYLNNVFHGNLGVSIIYYPEPVIKIISSSIWWTLFLVLIPIIIAFFIGNKLGSSAALSRGHIKDSVYTTAPMFMFGIPAFSFGIILMFIFSIKLGILPPLNAYKLGLTPGFNLPFITSFLIHAILPVSTIVLTTLSGWVFGMRNNMISILNSNFLRFQELMGVNPKIIKKNATRNAILPNINIGAVVYTESFI